MKKVLIVEDELPLLKVLTDKLSIFKLDDVVKIVKEKLRLQ